jgi:hypothetical protein
MANQYDGLTHTYTMDGVKIPSVTEVLKIVAPWKGPPGEPAHRGTFIHASCEMFELGGLDMDALDDDDRGMVQAWESYLADHPKLTNPMIEERMFSSRRFAGTADRVYLSERTIVDIKTGQPRPEHNLQLQAYAMLVEENHGKVKNLICVYLKNSGIYLETHYSPDQGLQNLFLSALACHNWRQINKIKGE